MEVRCKVRESGGNTEVNINFKIVCLCGSYIDMTYSFKLVHISSMLIRTHAHIVAPVRMVITETLWAFIHVLRVANVWSRRENVMI